MNSKSAKSRDQHVIIAGVNKCGTTSLFRYLSDHPDVRPSVVKELGFFLDYVTPIEDQTYANYRRKFQPPMMARNLALEASPIYFTSGVKVLDRIRSVVPDARFVVLLREPADRLYSYFRSAKSYDNYATKLLAGYDYDRFVDKAMSDVESNRDDPCASEFRRAISQGCYAWHARRFHAHFPPEVIHYVFFEDLRDAPLAVLRDICDFLQLTPSVYKNYDFTVENKSRSYRSDGLQRLAFHANKRAEKVLNRLPRLRRHLRAAYLALNEDQAGEVAEYPEEATRRLRAFYEPDSAELAAILRNAYPSRPLSSWLERAELAKESHAASQAVVESIDG